MLMLMSAVETGQMSAAETSVLSQQKKAQVQFWLTKVPVPSKNIKFGPKWVKNRGFGLNLVQKHARTVPEPLGRV